jgi:hypothetical protein
VSAARDAVYRKLCDNVLGLARKGPSVGRVKLRNQEREREREKKKEREREKEKERERERERERAGARLSRIFFR